MGSKEGTEKSSEAKQELAERQCWTEGLGRARNAPGHDNMRICDYNHNRAGGSLNLG
jgi:hypothetical protein